MEFDLYQIDSFTDQTFHGNPACVVPLKSWLSDEILLNIAKENAVAETAFFVENENGFHLKWFTPEIEMDLCGHATLAAAHAIKTILNYEPDTIAFTTLSGELKVILADGIYWLDFPSRPPVNADMPDVIRLALNLQPKQVLKSRDLVLVYDSEDEIKNIEVNRQIFDQINLDPGGVIVTAKGNTVDFVSRFFTPQSTILEDPVTGSAHCSLIPYWADRLNKSKMNAVQLSDRTGQLICLNVGKRVLIGGNAKTYSIGKFWIDNAIFSDNSFFTHTIAAGCKR